MTQDQAIRLINLELVRAEVLHPVWPKDIVHATAIMVEEAGEAIQAALDLTYDGGSVEHLMEELVQTGAMCVRALMNIERRG